MAPDNRKPPIALGRLSWNVLADDFDTPRDNPTGRKNQQASPSPDFDAAACPIIARHFFGVEPIGQVAAEIVADLRFQRKIQRVHAHGPRVTAELLAELGAERGIMTIVDLKLDKYAAMSPKALKAASSDQFWPSPIHGVGQ